MGYSDEKLIGCAILRPPKLGLHVVSRAILYKNDMFLSTRIKRDFLKHKTIKVRDNKLNRHFGVDITPLSR